MLQDLLQNLLSLTVYYSYLGLGTGCCNGSLPLCSSATLDDGYLSFLR